MATHSSGASGGCSARIWGLSATHNRGLRGVVATPPGRADVHSPSGGRLSGGYRKGQSNTYRMAPETSLAPP